MLRGAGVCVPLEGQVTSPHVVVNGYTALEHLRAEFFTDYTPYGDIPHWRAPDIGGAAWGMFLAEGHSGPVLALNEPNNPGKDGDAADAGVIARALAGVKLPLCFPNVMMGLESSRRWLRDYQAAGGQEPALHGAHCYATQGSDLVAMVSEWRGFLDGLGWHRPLVLTEVGPLRAPRPNSDADTAGVLRAAFALTEARRIHGFAWFSSRYPADNGKWAAGDLLRSDGSLLPLGVLYRQLATGAQQPGEPSGPLPGGSKVKPGLWLPVARA